MNENEIMKLMGTREDLNPELKMYIISMPTLGMAIKHPLVFSIPHHEGMNAYMNEVLQHKKEAVEEAAKEGRWESYIYLHERPYRFFAFSNIEKELSDQKYWELLGSIWADSENLWQQRPYIRKFLNSKRAGRENMMDEKERDLLDSLPIEFAVHRGYRTKNKEGFSWSLSYWRACWFSCRFAENKSPLVSSGRVYKQDVIALLNGRGEYEIVVDSKFVRKNVVSPIKDKKFRPSELSRVLRDLQLHRNSLGKNSYHGPWHWDKVEYNAGILADRTEGAHPVVARLFAALHDCKRQNEEKDSEHGKRAAEFAKELYSQGKFDPLKKAFYGFSQEDMDKLLYALEYHSKGQISDDPTIGVCWDADRLDLIRVGIVPAYSLLSTKAAKELMWKL